MYTTAFHWYIFIKFQSWIYLILKSGHLNLICIVLVSSQFEFFKIHFWTEEIRITIIGPHWWGLMLASMQHGGQHQVAMHYGMVSHFCVVNNQNRMLLLLLVYTLPGVNQHEALLQTTSLNTKKFYSSFPK